MSETESRPWIGIVDDEVVAKEKSLKELVAVLEKKYPNKTPVITSTPLCETMIL